MATRQQIYFRRDESFKIVVRQGAEARAGAAQKVALQSDELLVCDAQGRSGQTQIGVGDLEVLRIGRSPQWAGKQRFFIIGRGSYHSPRSRTRPHLM